MYLTIRYYVVCKLKSIPLCLGELSLALVISTKAHAELISVDASDALTMPGVIDFIAHKDVPAKNCFQEDEHIFAVDKV